MTSSSPLILTNWTRENEVAGKAARLNRLNDDDSLETSLVLSIRSVRLSQGGFYKCVASNYAGETSRVARLDVTGPPFIRPIPDQKWVSGSRIWLHCPYSGNPVTKVEWKKGGGCQGVALKEVWP